VPIPWGYQEYSDIDAATEHAELISLGVGKHPPPLLAVADIHRMSAKSNEPRNLIVAVTTHRTEVDMHAVRESLR
jgi:hypothetical protein